MSSPIDISPSPFSTRGPDASCAFPSWPRRSSLCEQDASEERATLYISDEDLFFDDAIEDDARSESSSGSSHAGGSPFQSPPLAPVPTEAEILEMQRQQAAYRREVMKLLLAEKEKRRRQAAAKRRAASKKSAKSRLPAMTPIAEAE